MNTKFVSIFLMFCLIGPISATFTFLHFQKNKVRKAVNRQILTGVNQQELVLLKFTKSDSETLLRWEHSREFEFDGGMYDIVEIKNNGDTTYYWCRFDEQETELNKQLNDLKLYTFGNIDNQNKNKSLVFFLKSLFFYKYQIWNNASFEATEIGCFYNCYTVFAYPPTVPPPEICLF